MSRTKACDGGCWKTYSYISYLKLKKNSCDSKCEEPRVFLKLCTGLKKKSMQFLMHPASLVQATQPLWAEVMALGTFLGRPNLRVETSPSLMVEGMARISILRRPCFFGHFLHPWKLTWNPKMKVWKMIILFKQVMFRFHVNFPGCTTDCVEWTTSPKWYPTRSCVEPAR